MPSTLQPVTNREIFLDALRGFAILGIFIANLSSFSGVDYPVVSQGQWYVPQWDNQMFFLHNVLIEGKFYSIFSLLFGWGLALQLTRSDEGQQVGLVRRRLAIMLLLGYIHLLIWRGDIVFLYACIGFLFLPLRNLSNKKLLIIAGCLLLSPILLYALKMNFPIVRAPEKFFDKVGKSILQDIANINNGEQYRQARENGDWLDHLQLNFGAMYLRFRQLLFISRIPKVLGMLLIGYVIGRSGFYQQFAKHKKLIIQVALVGLVIGLPANYYLSILLKENRYDYFDLKINGLYQTIVYAFGIAPMALAYVALFMLAFQHQSMQRLLGIFAPVGKMAFTNYIMQSLIGNFIFLNAGLGYSEKVGPVYYTLLALLVYLFQVILSTLWLRWFRFGPVEWVWRSLTYRKAQPILLKNDKKAPDLVQTA